MNKLVNVQLEEFQIKIHKRDPALFVTTSCRCAVAAERQLIEAPERITRCSPIGFKTVEIRLFENVAKRIVLTTK